MKKEEGVSRKFTAMASSWALPNPRGGHVQGKAVEPTRVRYTYYTAGSGGVGPTILETSFLLAGTDVVVYRDGQKVAPPLPPPPPPSGPLPAHSDCQLWSMESAKSTTPLTDW